MANIINNLGQILVGFRSPVLVSPPPSSVDADATAFIAAAGITNLVQAAAINTLVNDLKTYGLWTKMKALYPMVGGTATSHKFNLKDPRDLDAAYRLMFSGGFTHNSLGVVPNGTNSYANPFFMGTTFTSVNNAHISYYSQTSTETNANSVEIGCYSSVNSEVGLNIRRPNNGSGGVLFSENNFIPATNTDGKGLYLLSRTANNSSKYYKNNIVLTNATGIDASSTTPSRNVFLFTSGNLQNNNDGLYTTNKISSFISLGDGLTDVEATNFYNSVQKFQTTLGRQIGSPIVSDTNAQAFINAAGLTDLGQANAVNTLVTDLKTAGVWTKMKAIYPFVGGTAASHRFNLKDPRDLDAAFRLVFNGGGVHSSQGFLPNGTTSYANTNFIPSAGISNGASVHFSIYSNTNSFPTVNGGYKVNGGYQASPLKIFQLAFYKQPTGQSTYRSSLGGTTQLSVDSSNPTTQGFTLTNRTSATSLKLFQNNTLLGTNTTSETNGLPNVNMYLGAINGAGVIDSYNDIPHQFTSIGDGLTDTEAANFYTAVQKYQTTLGRQV